MTRKEDLCFFIEPTRKKNMKNSNHDIKTGIQEKCKRIIETIENEAFRRHKWAYQDIDRTGEMVMECMTDYDLILLNGDDKCIDLQYTPEGDRMKYYLLCITEQKYV